MADEIDPLKTTMAEVLADKKGLEEALAAVVEDLKEFKHEADKQYRVRQGINPNQMTKDVIGLIDDAVDDERKETRKMLDKVVGQMAGNGEGGSISSG